MIATPTRAPSSATATPFFEEGEGVQDGTSGVMTGVVAGAPRGMVGVATGSTIGVSTAVAPEGVGVNEGPAECAMSTVDGGCRLAGASLLSFAGVSGTVMSDAGMGATMAFPQPVQNFCPWTRGAPQEVQKF